MSGEKSKKKLSEFFHNEYEKLVNYVHRLINDTAERDAEDIIQDAMTNLFDKSDITLPIENLSAYIYKSIRNRIIDLFRREKKYQALNDNTTNLENISLSQIFHKGDDNPRSALEKQEIHSLLFDAIESLNEKERALIIATEFDQRSFRNLSQEWGIPMGTLLTRKSRAIQKIKNKFQELKIEK